jgi:hypothetical protein
MQTFGGTKNCLPLALAAWEKHAEVEDATREAESRTSKQRRREQEEREQRRRLADRGTTLSDEALTALKCRAEEAFVGDGVDRTRLGYEVLVKLKMDLRHGTCDRTSFALSHCWKRLHARSSFAGAISENRQNRHFCPLWRENRRSQGSF